MGIKGKRELLCLGIESTAHTFGVGIVTSSGRVLANEKSTFTGKGGIHPREAAEFHIRRFPLVIKKALERAQMSLSEVDLVAFSQGPGLPPCLRVGAVVARTLALRLKVPLVGVNHPIAHLEIGRLTTEAKDPLMVYVSGGNTQIIAYSGKRYRVFGETLDVPLGNALDVLGRELGLPFPAGPAIDAVAREGNWIDLPYVVKGMDFSFSGVLTEALKRIDAGERVEDVCFSFEHVCFAMVTEAAERAIAHTRKKELLLTGGVAAAPMLREMLKKMCRSRRISFHVPRREYCVDNGAMIAWTGIVEYESKGGIPIDKSGIRQRWRVDQVDVTWITEIRGKGRRSKRILGEGAEAILLRRKWLGLEAVEKVRVKKRYRDRNLDVKLRAERTRGEAFLLYKVKRAGVPAPAVYDVDIENFRIVMEYVPGRLLSDVLNSLDPEERRRICGTLGVYLGDMHRNGLVHGDLTTSNVILCGRKPVLIDLGLGKHSKDIEDFAVDLLLFRKSLENNHWVCVGECFESFLTGYEEAAEDGEAAIKRMEKVWRRGRYQER